MNAGMDSKMTSKEHDFPSTRSVPIFGRPRAFDTIVWGGLVAGVLDSIDADVAFGLNGMNPIQVLQFIASGLSVLLRSRADLQPRHWAPCSISSSRSLSPLSTTMLVASCLPFTSRRHHGGSYLV
jgi:hypothetical protein